MPTLNIDLSIAPGANAQIVRADFVRDLIYCLVDGEAHVVPFEWTIEATPESAAAAIDAYLNDEPFVVNGNGHGLFITLGQPSHPGAEVTGANFEHDLLDFKWIGATYGGDCSTPFIWSLSSSAGDIATALTAIVT